MFWVIAKAFAGSVDEDRICLVYKTLVRIVFAGI